MTKREIIALNESIPRLEAAQIGDTYQLPRDTYLTTGMLISEIADGATAVAHTFDTENALSTSGAKIASFQNNGTEKAYIDKDGSVYAAKYWAYAWGSIDFHYGITPGKYDIACNNSFYTGIKVSINSAEVWGFSDTANYSSNILHTNGIGFKQDLTATIAITDLVSDVVPGTIAVNSGTAWASASTNIVGSDLGLSGGDGASASAGDAHGGDVVLAGGTGYGTGVDGDVQVASTLDTQAGRIRNVTTVNAATYDLLIADDILHVTYTGTGAVTSLTLPTAQVTAGRTIVIKDGGGNAGTNNITIDTEGTENIDGASTLVLSTNYESATIYSDGTNWFNI